MIQEKADKDISSVGFFFFSKSSVQRKCTVRNKGAQESKEKEK
jgi:hypothetical protein